MPRVIRVKVHTRAHDEAVEEIGLDEYEVWLTSAPANNEANEELIEALSLHFGVAPSLIRIKSGGKSRHKLIEINE